MTRIAPFALGALLATSLLVSLSHSVVLKVENLPEKCDFSKCVAPDPKKINVHLVPHTHDDVGWLKTVDQYFYGSQTHIQKAGVQYILDSVMEELIRNKERRFIYVETAFFWKWWKEQDEEQKAIVQELVKSGQLEFINGGWSMNDEATTHYNSIIDSMSWGLRRLVDTFGKCGVPKVTWQIDPFGHSKEQAALFALMNYDAVYFAREDWQEQKSRRDNKTLEHVWQASDELGVSGDLFTGMMDFGYGPPQGFNWDLVGGADEPVIDNPESEEFNVPKLVQKLVDLAKRYQVSYATNHVMFPMGTDFQYQDAHIYFKNMDKLIRHVNEQSSEVKIFYSTPSCYTKALHDAQRTWTAKSDDYFPYASDPHAYWTGYFTSRPALKRYERVGNNVLQACKQLDVFAGNAGKYEKEITALREIMGVMQHHDAVAGTEKQHVSDNYAKNLHAGIESCRTVLSQSISKLQAKVTPPTVPKLDYCEYLNVSSCAATETGKNFAINLYNPLAHPLEAQIVRVPVAGGKFYEVLSPEGKPVHSELVEVPEYVRKLPGRPTNASTELVFSAKIPALGLASYFVQAQAAKSGDSAEEIKGVKIAKETKVAGSGYSLVFDASGALTTVELKSGGVVPFKNEFRYYNGADDDTRHSGAYVFRPKEQQTFLAAKLVESQLFTLDTPNGVVHEVHQKFDSFVEQVVRVVPDSDTIEFEWVVGPIPVADKIGKEIVASYATDLKNNRVFYTDANGRQMLQRKWDFRKEIKLEVTEPVSGNYYPINSRIFLRDEAKGLQFTVLNDRSQGGTSPSDGVLELMVHRRLLHDDYFGVGEPLSEPGVDGKGLIIRGKHLVQVAPIKEAASKHRPEAQKFFLEPIVAINTEVTTFDAFQKATNTQVSGLSSVLPPQVHLLTLEQWSNNKYLIRLEHIYQADEDAALSKPVTINLKNLFSNFEVKSAQELTLGANQDIAATKNRLVFNYTPDSKAVAPKEVAFDPATLDVTLNPMQIRTFSLEVTRIARSG